ncbi:cell division protein FtsA [Candidatus Saccharibacteria bacterium]|nr:cell division protein FtsA [Candidatus Saccharibacteria bacterium]
MALSEYLGEISVIANAEVRNNGGMSKGVITNLSGPVPALQRAMLEIDKISGKSLDNAYTSINGSHVGAVKTQGMISIMGGEVISNNDLGRIREISLAGVIPNNREALAIIPLNYTVDGQSGIRDPLGMNGMKLEMQASVVSALTPSCVNLRKLTGEAGIETDRIVPTAMAAARLVLTEQQKENGVALVDFGASTTSVAVFMDGFLQHYEVLNAGANNITNDLAIGLAVNPSIAEEIKLRYVSADFPESDRQITTKIADETISFTKDEVNQIVRERLIDIFERVEKILKAAGYAQKLPEGLVIVGGGAMMRNLDKFVKDLLGMAVRIGTSEVKLSGVYDLVDNPKYATAVGLALMMMDDGMMLGETGHESEGGGFFSIFNIFRKNKSFLK